MAPSAAQWAAPLLPRAPLALALLAVATAVSFLSFMWDATGGRFVPQTVDLYLVCQYAKAMAEGHPFRYYPGDPPTTGATSLLHTAVLAVAHKVGLRGEGLVAFAILAGALLLVASTELARRAGALLGGARTGWLAGGLVALGGPVAWGFLYGADVAVFMTLALWLLLELCSGWPAERVGRVAVVGVLIALTRPEGLLVALALGAASLCAPGRRRDTAARALAWAPLLAAILVLALNRAATGSWVGTSMSDKSLAATYGLAGALALTTEFIVDVVRGLLLGSYPSQAPIGFGRGWASLFFPPAGLVLIVFALARSDVRAWPLRLWAATVAAVWLMVAPNMFMGTHFNRYLLWAFPGLLVLAAAGLHGLSALLSRGDARLDRRLFAAGAGVFLFLGGLSTARFAVMYGELAGQVARRDLAAAEWIERLPPGTAIANVATSVEYLTGHRSVNLHGVTTAAFLGNRPAEREANVVEALARLPPPERPALLMATESALQGAPTLRGLTVDPPLFRTSSFSDEIVIARMQYGLLEGNDEPRRPETLAAVGGLSRVDSLNVCDTRDEAAHGYEFSSSAGNLRLAGAARVDSYGPPDAGARRLADGGRAVRGHERFTVSTRPGRDLLIVLRTAAIARANVWTVAAATAYDLEFPEAVVALSVDGQPAGTTTRQMRPGWDELLLKVDGALVVGPRTVLELRGRYASFRYWIYQ